MTTRNGAPTNAPASVDAREVLDSFEGLRVTDVCDGMDALGMHDMGQMSRDIRPLWRDTDTFAHRIYGIAHTVRFVPTQRPVPEQTPDEFYDWMRNWYGTLARGPFVDQIRPRDLIVIDGYELGSTGFIGSNNALSWIAAGAVGVVTNGGARDTDELIKQRTPVYSRYISRTVRPGRVELDAVQVPVNVGGALVNPGDVVVADGDGVVVVPAGRAADVAEQAWRHAINDKAGRRELYRRAGLAEDWTVTDPGR
jgi:4-hydroxy-4-methyl-2-oxoglutarate aldolase